MGLNDPFFFFIITSNTNYYSYVTNITSIHSYIRKNKKTQKIKVVSTLLKKKVKKKFFLYMGGSKVDFDNWCY